MWEQVDISLAKMRNRDASNTSGVLVNLALFPESREWAEKKEPGAHCLLILIFPQNFREFENFRKICSITLTSMRHADLYHMKDQECMMTSFFIVEGGGRTCNFLF